MDTEIMLHLLQDADVVGNVLSFCEGFPEYRQSKERLSDWYDKVEKLLGKQEFYEMEMAISHYFSWEAQAYYAFGLGLRDELKRALML